ncbi:MAG: hypothetical protein BMS9Abin34_263 [Patescibacteria group bacterium]|nr:MAG: hypothetical protein BMS9Abin34_263 [Patescibacteria group bacterium]
MRKPLRQKFLFVLREVFSDALYTVVAVSLAVNLLIIYYFILLQTTTLKVFLQSNSAFYNVTVLASTVLISILFGLAASFLAYQWRLRKVDRSLSAESSSEGILGGVFGAISSGCPVCGAWLVSALGIGGGLAAFPFQGLELKGLALIFLGWSVYSSTEAIYNQKKKICPPPKTRWAKYLPYAAALAAIGLLFALPILSTKYDWKISFQSGKQNPAVSKNQIATSSSSLLSAILPSEGYTINASYGDIGPGMLESGVIDLNKFKQIYERSGQPLTKEQLMILTKGSDEKITITQDNAYFLINVLWAFGLANKNPILEEGPLMKYGGLSGIGGFASTGGWSLGKSKATDYYSKSSLVVLDSNQQKELEDFAYNSYRPCCNNSTAFADCNHGMAALGLGEIMAGQGASADEIFAAQKYFNSFWFPQQYLDLAKYFEVQEGKSWAEVDPRVVMGEEYSTASGWTRVRNWLEANDAVEEVPSSGGGCGV